MIRFIVFTLFTLACASFILAIPNFSKAGDPIRLGSVPPQQILDSEPVLELPEELERSELLDKDWIHLDSRRFFHAEGGIGGSAIYSKAETETGEELKEEDFYAKIYVRIWGYRNRQKRNTERYEVSAGFLEFHSTHDGKDLHVQFIPFQFEGVYAPLKASLQLIPVTYERKINGPYRDILDIDLARIGIGFETTFGEEIPVTLSCLAGGTFFGSHEVQYEKGFFRRFRDTPDGPVFIPDRENFQDSGSLARSVFGEIAVIVEPFTLELGAKYLRAKAERDSSTSDDDEKRHLLSGYSRLSVEFLENFRAFVQASYEELSSELGSRELSGEFITVEFGVLGFHH